MDVSEVLQVLRGTGNGDIVDQYVRFCQIADAKREQYGRTSEAIEETLRECKAKGILVPYLISRRSEQALATAGIPEAERPRYEALLR